MALFGSPLDKARTLVLDAIKGLGANPDQSRIGPDTWFLAKGSAAVVIRLVAQDPNSKYAFLQIASPVMKAPAATAFHEHLARLNYEMGGLATFALNPTGEVHLVAARTIDGLNATEISQLVAQVAHFSDLYDDKLLAQYGRQYAIHGGQRS